MQVDEISPFVNSGTDAPLVVPPGSVGCRLLSAAESDETLPVDNPPEAAQDRRSTAGGETVATEAAADLPSNAEGEVVDRLRTPASQGSALAAGHHTGSSLSAPVSSPSTTPDGAAVHPPFETPASNPGSSKSALTDPPVYGHLPGDADLSAHAGNTPAAPIEIAPALPVLAEPPASSTTDSLPALTGPPAAAAAATHVLPVLAGPPAAAAAAQQDAAAAATDALPVLAGPPAAAAAAQQDVANRPSIFDIDIAAEDIVSRLQLISVADLECDELEKFDAACRANNTAYGRPGANNLHYRYNAGKSEKIWTDGGYMVHVKPSVGNSPSTPLSLMMMCQIVDSRTAPASGGGRYQANALPPHRGYGTHNYKLGVGVKIAAPPMILRRLLCDIGDSLGLLPVFQTYDLRSQFALLHKTKAAARDSNLNNSANPGVSPCYIRS
ncbi:hypothetical protein HDU96_004020 [Phlyctochytrium bullatum]|nr:hypothetical protein HDU96_004020 [Phlyctochytrium bullatum]